MEQQEKQQLEDLVKYLDILPPETKKKVLHYIEEQKRLYHEKEEFRKYNKYLEYVPYPKQKEFHNAGKDYREILFMAGNQLGKTVAGAYHVMFHATGLYPDWWEGRRFTEPTRGIVGSESARLTAAGVQRYLLGKPEDQSEWGSGSIPKHLIVDFKKISGTANSVDTLTVRHVSGGMSVIKFASYDQGSSKWQSETLDYVWLDEEPPLSVFSEAQTRLNVRDGEMIITFTPLKGVSEVVKGFYPECTLKTRKVIHMGIFDVPHYTKEYAEQTLEKYPIHQRQARGFGLPIFGDGAVFDLDIASLVIPSFKIPDHFKKVAAMDFGWNHKAAVVLMAIDPETDIKYVVQTFSAKEKKPYEIWQACKAWVDGIPVAFPHDGWQHEKGSGLVVANQFKSAGFKMMEKHAQYEQGGFQIEPSIQALIEEMENGRFKIFNHCIDLISELGQYHRKDGKIVKKNDDTISAMRYAYMMRRYAIAKSSKRERWVDELMLSTGGNYYKNAA